MTPEWVGAIVGVAVAVVAVLVAPGIAKLRRSRSAAPVVPSVPGERYDLFVSHAPADLSVAERVATDLQERHGLKVFLPRWQNLPGVVRALRRGEGILAATPGVFLFSAAAGADGEVLGDYADAFGRGAGRLLVPARVDGTVLPAFVDAAAAVDLRSGPAYEAELGRLAGMLRA